LFLIHNLVSFQLTDDDYSKLNIFLIILEKLVFHSKATPPDERGEFSEERERNTTKVKKTKQREGVTRTNHRKRGSLLPLNLLLIVVKVLQTKLLLMVNDHKSKV
jgi:hypothetical protein